MSVIVACYEAIHKWLTNDLMHFLAPWLYDD